MFLYSCNCLFTFDDLELTKNLVCFVMDQLGSHDSNCRHIEGEKLQLSTNHRLQPEELREHRLHLILGFIQSWSSSFIFHLTFSIALEQMLPQIEGNRSVNQSDCVLASRCEETVQQEQLRARAFRLVMSLMMDSEAKASFQLNFKSFKELPAINRLFVNLVLTEVIFGWK